MNTPIIDSQNVPLWTASAVILSLLALVVAFAGIYRTHIVIVGTQSEVLSLNKKIENLSARRGAPAPAPAAPAKP